MKLLLEMAATPAKLAHGLMGRQELAADRGMLFKFPEPVIDCSFWGKDTYIPLDIAFVDNNNTITSIKTITPMSTLRVVGNGICYMAIETNLGFFKKHSIFPGSKVKLSNTDNGIIEASFESSQKRGSG